MASLLQMLGDFPRASRFPLLQNTHSSNTHLQRLAEFLDRPGFPWKKLILGFSIGQFALEGLLSLRQYSVLQRTKPPKALKEEISQETFDKSQVRALRNYSRLHTDHHRHTAAPNPSSASSPASTRRSRTTCSSNTTSSPSSGPSPAPGSPSTFLRASPAR